MVHTLWPKGVRQTQIVSDWLVSEAVAGRPDNNPEDAVKFRDQTNRQDWQVSELTQLGVASRAYTPSPYSSSESLLAAFDRQYGQVMGK
jgi:Rieske 2Fe-2S family protein